MTQVVDALRPSVAAAVEHGRLRADVRAETFAMTTVGPLVYQRFLVGSTLGSETVDMVVDAALPARAPWKRHLLGPVPPSPRCAGRAE